MPTTSAPTAEAVITDVLARAGVASSTISVTSAAAPAPIRLWSERSTPATAPANVARQWFNANGVSALDDLPVSFVTLAA